MMRKNPDSEKHIKRIQEAGRGKGGTRGFQVHFSRNGRLWTKFFSDGKCGSKEKARRQARKHRDLLLKKVPASVAKSPFRAQAVGYSIRSRKNRNGKVTRYVSASAAAEKGKLVRKAFRIDRNKTIAIEAALAWRASIARRRIRLEKKK